MRSRTASGRWRSAVWIRPVGYRVLGNSFTSSVLLVGPAVGAAVLAAWILNRLVETPSGRFSKRVNLGEGPLLVAARKAAPPKPREESGAQPLPSAD
jgi:peptidoglycan/LPS O-acetylase OafA/YrhL